VKSVIHKREVCNQVPFNSHSTVKTEIKEPCAMSLELPPLVRSGVFFVFL